VHICIFCLHAKNKRINKRAKMLVNDFFSVRAAFLPISRYKAEPRSADSLLPPFLPIALKKSDPHFLANFSPPFFLLLAVSFCVSMQF
jgi:hypothetical protein